MSHKKLINFKEIIDREDFTFISNHENIIVTQTYLKKIIFNEPVYNIEIAFIQKYKDQLDVFANWINIDLSKDLREGYNSCNQELKRYLQLINDKKRVEISSSMTRKWSKNFTNGLNKILRGIRAAFDPAVMNNFAFTDTQLCRYILDKKEGLAKKFAFNKYGSAYSSAKKIWSLNSNELKALIKQLVNLTEMRTENSWVDLGKGKTIIRVLTKPVFGRKDKVYFIYTMAEHIKKNGPYRKILTEGYEKHKHEFEAA